MALNRDKFRKIVGGITTAEPQEPPSLEPAVSDAAATSASPVQPSPSVEQERAATLPERRAEKEAATAEASEHRRFAKRGRPKGTKETGTNGKAHKVKVSLFLSEVLVNDLYEWAHTDKIHPGEMFERALKPFHEREAKRRNTGKE